MYTYFSYCFNYHILFFFFFQAEDGIRDYKVTGVQTCALPILRRLWTMSVLPLSFGRTVRPNCAPNAASSDGEPVSQEIGRASCRERGESGGGEGGGQKKREKRKEDSGTHEREESVKKAERNNK